MISHANIQSLLQLEIAEEQFNVALELSKSAVDSYLPPSLSIATLTDHNLERAESIVTQLLLRVLSNPVGASSTSFDGVSTSFSSDGLGISPLTLRKSEKDVLDKIQKPNTTQKRSASFNVDW